jgi:hypothetical protein
MRRMHQKPMSRIKRDFHLQQYNDALALYASDPDYWERWYAPPPSPDPAAEIQHDSVMAAGVPSRYNVFEYGYPKPSAPSGEDFFNPNKVVNDRIGNWRYFPTTVASPNAPAPSPPQPAQIDPRDVRALRGRTAGKAATSVFDTGAPAVPYVPPGASIAPGRQDAFNDRFGNWTSPQANPAQNDAQKTRVLKGDVAVPDGSRLPLPGPEQAPQGQSIPNYQLPPPIFGLPDQSASGSDMDDWFSRWIKPLMRQ